MDKSPRSKPGPASAAGPTWRPSAGRLVIALLLAMAGGAALWLLWMPSGSAPAPAPVLADATPATRAAPAPSPGKAAAVLPKPQAPAPEGDADPTPDLKSYVARGENPSMSQVIERLHQRGIHTGLGAFSPPGTSPPLVGLAVPEDFVLPKGYVRHHQATDDGQRIEAILMFAPDAANQAPDMPKNRVVPPELAPPGLPIRRIVIPPNIEPANAGR